MPGLWDQPESLHLVGYLLNASTLSGARENTQLDRRASCLFFRIHFRMALKAPWLPHAALTSVVSCVSAHTLV